MNASPLPEESPAHRMPPFVYVPTTAGPQDERRVILHQVQDGRTALYTYSAPDRVDSIYQAGTPWIGCDMAALQRIHDATPYDLLFVDVDPALSQAGDSE